MNRLLVILMTVSVSIAAVAVRAQEGLTGPFLSAVLEADTTVMTGFIPEEGTTVTGTSGPVRLTRTEKLVLPASGHPSTVLAACYLEAPSFQTVTVKPAKDVTAHIFLDDQPVRPNTERPLRTGKHKLILLLKATGDEPVENPIQLVGFEGAISLNPVRPLSHLDYAALRTPRWMTTSPNGRMVAIQVSSRNPKGKVREELQVVWLNTKPVSRMTLPDGKHPVFSRDNRYLYYTREKTLYRLSLKDRISTTVRPLEKPIASLVMGPKDRFIYFAMPDTWKPKKKGDYELLTELRHRRPSWKRRSFLMAISTDGLVLRKLAGPVQLGDWDLRPGKVLFVTSEPLNHYPWSRSLVKELHLDTGQLRIIGTFNRGISDIHYRSDTEAVLVSQRKPYDESHPANFYDTALFSLSLSDGKLTPLTGQQPFAMGIDIIYTSQTSDTLSVAKDGSVTFIATLHGKGAVYRLANQQLKQLHTPNGMVTGFSVQGGHRLFMVSDINRYPVLIRDGEPVLDFQDGKRMAPVRLSPYRSLDFPSRNGYTIHNDLIYPAGYTKGKTYPMVVFYYGGVVPCGPVFHPTLQWLAGNGYFVLITTPRGAVGHGARFADEHVNEWGEKSAADLIEAATWIAEHEPGVDRERIGAYSGSYGGFLAMSLATKTTLFKALISEYGISNIASYWGAGYWGYLYGMAALGGSYPWNARHIFVDKSPLFHADRVQTPLLLMHGDSDVNVPVVESDQMFTALKVLGKETAYVRFFGEDHGMKGKFSNWLAQEDFVIAWFDRYLKGQPAFWNYLVKETLPVPKHEPLKDYFFYGEQKHE